MTDNEAPGITCPSDLVLVLDSTDCVARQLLPLPSIVTDNCIFGGASDILTPMDSIDALLTYVFQPDLLDYIADDRILSFQNVARSTLNDVSLTLSLRGDMDNTLGYFDILGEDGTLLGTTQVGQPNVNAGDCITFGQISLTIPASSYNAWAADGQLDITAATNRNLPIPPSGPGDGFNPCNSALVTQDGATDGNSMLFGRLTYNDINYSYYTQGATNTPLTVVSDTVAQAEIDFAIGTSEVFYIIEDANSNRDTCSFLVTVQDNEAPMAVCQSTRFFINPSGTLVDTLRPINVNGGSTDNCSIDSMWVSPNVFACDTTFPEFVDVTLTVLDEGGNMAACTAAVNIVTETPTPNFFIRPCGGDTLFLYANPPAIASGASYLYNWTGPNGFTSNDENPMIPGATTFNEGSYSVSVMGQTGCMASGTVEVSLDEDVVRPNIDVPSNICSTDDLMLTTNRVSANNIIYLWYEITASGDSLVGTSISSSLTFGGDKAPGAASYAVQLSIDGCLTNLSDPQTVEITAIPEVRILNVNPAPLCEGETLELATDVTGVDLSYEWTGPNGFRATDQLPAALQDVSALDEGTYYLTISRNGCQSDRESTEIQVTSRPAPPVLFNSGPICAGEDITLMVSDTTADVYHWLPPNSNSEFTTSGTNGDTLLVAAPTAVDAGAWRAYITTNNCSSELSSPSTIVINTVPDLAVSANPNTLCAGSTLTLEASPTLLGATYLWTGPDSYMAATQNPLLPNITPQSQGVYTCVITSAEGCMNQDTVQVTVDAGVEIMEIQDNGQQCNSGPTDILMRAILSPPDDGTYEYRWTGPNNYTSTDSIATIPGATEEDNGNYILDVVNASGCPSTTSNIVISIRDIPATPAAPTLSQGTPMPFCEGEIMTLVTSTSYSGQQVEYNWITPEGIKQTNIPSYTDNELDSYKKCVLSYC
ncbi:MAG: immunoglobulin domain-containing protein [Bacteroidota bacterium]